MRNTRFRACPGGRSGSTSTYIPRRNQRIIARAPLSDLQYAYLLGEFGDDSLSGPALFYEEYACERLDLIAFSGALHRLMARHEMLRATFDASGTVRVHGDLPVPLSYQSLRGLPEEECRQRLAASRDECCQDGTPMADAAPFAIRVFALDDEMIVQVVGRLLAIDGPSREIFTRELCALLTGVDLPPLRYTFREHRVDAERRKELPEYLAARGYWLDRLDSLPAPPRLPRARGTAAPDPRPRRRTFTLPVGQWKALVHTAERNRLLPTMVIGIAFCDVLRHWAASPHFTVNLIHGDRASAHPDISNVIGNFTNSLLCEYAPGPQARTFLDRARGWHRQLDRDLRYSVFSGASVARELNQRGGDPPDAMPVAFTSTLESDTGGAEFLEYLGWHRLESVVRTPHVPLHNRASVVDGELVVCWDTADEAYAPGLVDDLFSAYQATLTRLATSDSAWYRESFDVPPAAHDPVPTWAGDRSVPAVSMPWDEMLPGYHAPRTAGRYPMASYSTADTIELPAPNQPS